VLLQLKPGLLRVSRGQGAVQIGLAHAHGTILSGLLPDDLALLDRLGDGLDEAELTPADPDPRPERTARLRRLVGILTESGALLRVRTGRAALSRLGPDADRLAADAAVWSLIHPDAADGWELLAARTHRTVEIRGEGRTASALAATLTAMGVGTVRCHAPWGEHADLVVLMCRAAADAGAAQPLVARDVPHLVVVVRETSVQVGPLVDPGHGPCLRCLDLHRGDRDPQWPLVLAQLLSPRTTRAAPREETATARLAASLAALQVVGHLDGRRTPAAHGATLECDLPDGLVSRRPWPVHPACGCHWPPQCAAPDSPTPDARAEAGPVTMLR
jgi:bacteriocin biosynthesis cyclodehydratase domain-containing protein